ncbi:MAG: hypothetical protein VX223_04550 [Myxococcota bacterium]|nr:hypothetical protein [Myxococcota bacterium]
MHLTTVTQEPAREVRWRLRNKDGLVGYQRQLPTGIQLYAKDRLYWSGDPIDYDKRDRWSGLQDIDRNHVFAGDVVHIKSLEEQGVHPQWVVADAPWRLESLDGLISRPLFDDDGLTRHNFNDLRIITHVWKSREIRALRAQHLGSSPSNNAISSTKRLVVIHVTASTISLCAFGLAFGSLGLFALIFSVTFGAWLGHRFAGHRERAGNLRAGRHSATAHAVIGAIAYVVAWTQWPEQWEFTAIQLVWAAPAVGFLVGLPALAAVILVGDVIAHLAGGYADE